MAVELQEENASFVGFPIVLLLKEKYGFSARVDCGESIQSAAQHVLQETQILRSDLSSMDFAMFPEDHARAGMSVKIQQVMTEIPKNCRSHKIPKFCITLCFFEKSVCFGDCSLQAESSSLL